MHEYLSLYNRAFGTRVTAGELGHGDRIVKRLSDLNGGTYDHHKPADVILRHPEFRDSLSEDTLARFEKLFERINSTHA